MEDSFNRLLSIRNMIVFQNFCGFYHMCSEKLYISRIIKIYCVALAIVLSVFCFQNPDITYLSWDVVWVTFGYTLNVIICLRYNGNYFFQYWNGLHEIDIKMNLTSIDKEKVPISRAVFTVFLILRSTAFAMTIFVFGYLQTGILSNTIISIYSINLTEFYRNMSNIPMLLMFETFYVRIKILKEQLCSELSTVLGCNNDARQLKLILKYLRNYRSLVRQLMDTTIPFKILVSMETYFRRMF